MDIISVAPGVGSLVAMRALFPYLGYARGLFLMLFVSAGAQHTVALGADKQLYAWGTASQSKGGGSCLGMGAGTTSVDEPEPIYDPD